MNCLRPHGHHALSRFPQALSWMGTASELDGE